MNLKNLISCVEFAKNHALSDINFDDMLKELKEIESRYNDDETADIWGNEVVVVTSNDYTDLGNLLLYDYYGELYVANNKQDVTIERFISYVRDGYLHSIGFEQATDSMLHDCYCLISDLYYDNEQEGAHDEKGHFRKGR